MLGKEFIAILSASPVVIADDIERSRDAAETYEVKVYLIMEPSPW